MIELVTFAAKREVSGTTPIAMTRVFAETRRRQEWGAHLRR
jgi:hypothetical protein